MAQMKRNLKRSSGRGQQVGKHGGLGWRRAGEDVCERTLPDHWFYPGTVTIQVDPSPGVVQRLRSRVKEVAQIRAADGAAWSCSTPGTFSIPTPWWQCAQIRSKTELAMETNFRRCVVTVLACVGLLAGCAQGKRPFLIVQLCLNDQQNLALFKSMMKSVADAKSMTFLDRSSRTEADLKASGKVLDRLKQGTPIVNLGIDGKDGIGMSATNVGLPTSQLALGFSEGSRPSEARKFADEVVAQLQRVWHVEVVPEGKGAIPLQTCGTVTGT